MFETMIHSTEELNAMAVHLRLSENFSELKLLASEWLVPEEYVQDFIAGKRAQLAEIPFEEREYDSAVEKLRAEMWLIKDQMFTDIVSKYLIRKAEDNPVFGMQVLQKHKTIQKCMNYIMEQAYEIAKKEHEKKTSGKNRRQDGIRMWRWGFQNFRCINGQKITMHWMMQKKRLRKERKSRRKG